METEMVQTLAKVIDKTKITITEEWSNIVKAYENHNFDLTVNLKIILDGESLDVVQIGTALNYYPLPKREVKPEKSTVDEKQTQLFK